MSLSHPFDSDSDCARFTLKPLDERALVTPAAIADYANQLPEQVEAAIVAAKREKPHWGGRGIRESLVRRVDSTRKQIIRKKLPRKAPFAMKTLCLS